MQLEIRAQNLNACHWERLWRQLESIDIKALALVLCFLTRNKPVACGCKADQRCYWQVSGNPGTLDTNSSSEMMLRTAITLAFADSFN